MMYIGNSYLVVLLIHQCKSYSCHLHFTVVIDFIHIKYHLKLHQGNKGKRLLFAEDVFLIAPNTLFAENFVF